jgi:hypothetical protein
MPTANIGQLQEAIEAAEKEVAAARAECVKTGTISPRLQRAEARLTKAEHDFHWKGSGGRFLEAD